MQKSKKRMGKAVSMFIIASMILTVLSMSAFAAGHEGMEAGYYTVDAELSCFVPAMGGIEFGKPLLTSTEVEVKEDGSAAMKLFFTKSQVTIYGVTCDTFIDPNYMVGFYDGANWDTDVLVRNSDDTALNPANEPINYVSEIVFQIPNASDIYQLALYVNSNVMGVQFGGASASYNATLTVDWDSAKKVVEADETSTQNAAVHYSVTGGYEVKIPAAINVDPTTKVGAYEVEAVNFVIPKDAYITVTADPAGTVSNGAKSLPFTNELASKILLATGDKLDGAVTVTGNPTAAGNYTGTLEFTIKYFTE